jgi:hypothetical protein
MIGQDKVKGLQMMVIKKINNITQKCLIKFGFDVFTIYICITKVKDNFFQLTTFYYIIDLTYGV